MPERMCLARCLIQLMLADVRCRARPPWPTVVRLRRTTVSEEDISRAFCQAFLLLINQYDIERPSFFLPEGDAFSNNET